MFQIQKPLQLWTYTDDSNVYAIRYQCGFIIFLFVLDFVLLPMKTYEIGDICLDIAGFL